MLSTSSLSEMLSLIEFPGMFLATFTPAESERYASLEEEQLRALLARDLTAHAQAREAQGNLGTACPMYTHSFSESGKPRMVYLHPQAICDAMTVVELSQTFLGHWHGRA